MADRSLALALYRGFGRLIPPALPVLVALRARRGKEDRTRSGERFGRASRPRPEGPLVWVHAASVGETNAVMPLVGRLVAAGHAVVLTTTTLTSARIAADRLPQGAVHQFVPFDTAGPVRRFLDHWRPEAAIFVESEIWPTMLSALKARGIAIAVVNARLSERSWRRWKATGSIARGVFGMIGASVAQTEGDAARFRDLGVASSLAAGNLKFDVDPQPADPAAVAALAAEIGARPVWIAASTHPGEDEMVIAAHRQLTASFPDILTLLVPRHPERGDAIAALLAQNALAFSRRSKGEPVPAGPSVYLADTIGEMGLFYRQARVAFLGGSLVPHGGHNPIEPAQLGAAIVTGPHVHNFRDVYTEFDRAAAIAKVDDASGLAKEVGRLLQNQSDTDALIARAATIVDAGRGGIERTFEALRPLLSERA